MNTSAYDLLRLLPEVERISVAKIDDTKKRKILFELLNAVPQPVFCGAAIATRELVIETIEGAINGCAENTKKEISTKEGKRTSSTQSSQEELFPDTNGDGRRQSLETPLVNKATKKRRSTSRST